MDFKLVPICSEVDHEIEYNYKEGEIYGKPVVKSFSFNENYYYSNEFYGLLAEGKVNGNNYCQKCR